MTTARPNLLEAALDAYRARRSVETCLEQSRMPHPPA
jgi:hypothetical protein